MKTSLLPPDWLEKILALLYKEPLLTMFLVCMAIVGFALYVVLQAIS